MTVAPARASRARAMGVSSLLQLLTPSAMMYTLWPALSRSMAVCVTQMWLSMPTRMQASGPVVRRASSACWTWGVLCRNQWEGGIACGHRLQHGEACFVDVA